MNDIIQKIEEIERELMNSKPKNSETDFFENLLKQKSVEIPELLKIGQLNRNNLQFPAMIPFADSKGICIHLNENNQHQSHFLMQWLSLQLMQRIEKDLYKFHFIDTQNYGADFAIASHLSDKIIGNGIITNELDIKNLIIELNNQAPYIIQKNLGYKYKTLTDYNKNSGFTEPYRFLFISNFPSGFTKDQINDLSKLIENGKRIGLYIVLSYNKNISVSHNNSEPEILINKMIQIIPNEQEKYIIKNIENSELFNEHFDFELDCIHNEIDINQIESSINSINQEYNDINFSDIQTEGISISIGREGTSEFFFEIGFDSSQKETPHHAIIGGQSGKGKSILLNNIIAKGIEKYTPEELNFVLLDCKGSGFQEFLEPSKYIKAICITSNILEGIKIIDYIIQEMKRRENLFQQDTVRAKDINDYRKKTNLPLPRLICIIDEFHMLFTDNSREGRNIAATAEKALLKELIKIGRSYGIHLIVCTTSLGGEVGTKILDNFPLRIALGMTEEQSIRFLGFGNKAATNLPKGQAIYNPQNGDPKVNRKIKVNYIDGEELTQIISETNLKFTNID